MTNIPVILGCFGLCFYSLTFLTCITMIILIYIRIHSLKSNICMLLIWNTYFTLFLFASIMLRMYLYNLYGNLDSSMSFGGRWCQIRTYLVHVCLCGLYYSFVLQAIFRLFRIVFYKYKILQSFGVFLIAITLQWILSFLCILPHLLLDDFQYLPTEYNCWIAFENIRGLLVTITITYGISTCMILSIYMYIIRYLRQSNNIQQQRRHNANKRDLIVLKRLAIFVTVIIGLGFPTVLVVFIYVFTHYVIPLAYHIQGVSLSIGAFITSVSLVFITPQIQKIFKQSAEQIQRTMSINRSCNVQRIP